MRYVQIASRFLTHPYGAIVAQDRLNMDDDKLDEFIAAGFAIEFEMDDDDGIGDHEPT